MSRIFKLSPLDGILWLFYREFLNGLSKIQNPNAYVNVALAMIEGWQETE